MRCGHVQPGDPICRCPAAEQLVSGCFQVTRPCLGRAEECERGCYEVGGGCKCLFRISLAVPGTEAWPLDAEPIGGLEPLRAMVGLSSSDPTKRRVERVPSPGTLDEGSN